MKKLISYSFALLIIFNACGYLFIYLWADAGQKKFFESEVLGGDKKNKMISLSVYTEDVVSGNVYKSDEHEWMINGKLYDVLNYSRSGNVISFTCFHDTKEELAQQVLEKSVSLQFGTGSSKHDDNSKNNSAQKDVKYFSRKDHFKASSIGIVFYTSDYKPFIYSSPVNLIDSPPPRAC